MQWAKEAKHLTCIAGAVLSVQYTMPDTHCTGIFYWTVLPPTIFGQNIGSLGPLFSFAHPTECWNIGSTLKSEKYSGPRWSALMGIGVVRIIRGSGYTEIRTTEGNSVVWVTWKNQQLYSSKTRVPVLPSRRLFQISIRVFVGISHSYNVGLATTDCVRKWEFYIQMIFAVFWQHCSPSGSDNNFLLKQTL